MAETKAPSGNGTATEHSLRVDGSPASAGTAGETAVHRHRKCITCCGVTVALVVALVVVVVILIFTVLKPKNPSITIEQVTLEGITLRLEVLPLLQWSGNLTLGIAVSVKNPNKASFKFTNSTALLYYRSTHVGEVPVGAGNLKADGELSTNLTATILADRFVSNPNWSADFLAQSLPFTTTTDVEGRINFLNIYKKHATASSVCNTTIFLNNATTGDLHCDYKTRL